MLTEIEHWASICTFAISDLPTALPFPPSGLVTHAADELALIDAPAEMQTLLYGISHTLLGVSQMIAAFFILSQNSPHTYWCFFCYISPRTGLLTFLFTAVAMLLLFPLYLALSRMYRKVEGKIIKPHNENILPEGYFSDLRRDKWRTAAALGVLNCCLPANSRTVEDER